MKTKWWVRPTAWILHKVLLLYFLTLRVRYEGKERTISLLKESSLGYVFIMWHDSLLVALFLSWLTRFQPMHVLISNSRDGDLPSAVLSHYSRLYPLRVKHLARAQAIRSACDLLEERRSIFITPDGPRGPRRQMKSGVLYACESTGAQAIPICVAMSRCIQLSSWDRFRIPLPFSRVMISLGEPFVCKDSEEDKRRLTENLNLGEKHLESLLDR